MTQCLEYTLDLLKLLYFHQYLLPVFNLHIAFLKNRYTDIDLYMHFKGLNRSPFTTDLVTFTFTFSHLADAFIQSDLQLGVHKAINLEEANIQRKCQ